jgi:hypothetical protein
VVHKLYTKSQNLQLKLSLRDVLRKLILECPVLKPPVFSIT